MNSFARHFTIIQAPSFLGLKPSGVNLLPDRLLSHELAGRINASSAGRLAVPVYSHVRDADTKTLNAHAIAEWSPRLADAVGKVLDEGEFPLVLGGDCSILLGTTLALRRRGRFGLLFIDGHADFYQPEANPNGEAASMDLAFVTGHGPDLLTNIEGLRPLVRETDAFAFGFRDEEEQRSYGSQPLPPSLRSLNLDAVRRKGVTQAADEALAHVSRDELDGFFIHLDADCLNDDVMPAVDYRLPDGFMPEELVQVLKVALSSEKACGLEVTIYNPALDEDGRAGQQLTDILVNALGVMPYAARNAAVK
jgi:arginase